jgi:hypothetical protein
LHTTHCRRRSLPQSLPPLYDCRKFERFFEHFHEYDNVVIATFPTCHDPTLRALLALHLPQRYIALVHNPEYLNSTNVSELLVQGDVRVLSISPHVGQYTRQILEAQGAGEVCCVC